MARKILSGILVGFSSALLLLSMIGVMWIWVSRSSMTLEAVSRLQEIDVELESAQSAIQASRIELERTLRLVEAAETAMESLKEEFSTVKELFDDTTGFLDNQLLPGLITSREKIEQAKNTLQSLRDLLAEINSLPVMQIDLPGDQLLGDLIGSADSLDTQIGNVEDKVKTASTFISDTSYLMGGDLTETKNNLQNFLALVKDYDQKVTGWRVQVTELLVSVPKWITWTSIGLSFFLLWFGFSQFSLILQGLSIWQGGNPWLVLGRNNSKV